MLYSYLFIKFHKMTHAKSIFLKYSSNRHGSRWGGGGGGGGLKPPHFLCQWYVYELLESVVYLNEGNL